jgi:hypothetical protein
MDSRQANSLVSFLLKLICAILVLSFLLDFAFLISPSQILEPTRQWQVGFVSQIVDRGAVPLVGLAFLLTALWMDSTAGVAGPKGLGRGLGVLAFLLSTLLGRFFILVIPVHMNNVNFVRGENLKRIEQEATRAESQLDAQIQQQQSQISGLLNDNQRLSELEKAIQSGQVQGEQLTQLQTLQQNLQRFRQDPAALTKQAKDSRNQALTSIRERRQQLESQARTESLKSGMRIGLSSLLLTFGYAAIGWIGLRSLGIGSKASAR